MSKLIAATAAYAFVSIAIDRGILVAVEQHLNAAGCKYGWGDKAPALNADTSQIKEIDCSGFARFALYRASSYDIGDGSVQQHDFVKAQGFKPSTYQDAHNTDNAVRIAFLPPLKGEPGHVMLILNGYTLESCGSHGPCRRVWGSEGFMSRCDIFVLAPPL